MRIKPLHNYVHIEMIDPTEKIGEIIFVKNDRRPRWGKVVAIGEGTYDITGNIIKPLIVPDDMVYVLLHGPEVVQVLKTDEKVVFVSELDCLAKWNKEEKMLQPLGDYVQIEYLAPPEELSPGGLVLPESMRKVCTKQVAKVINVGTGLRVPDGALLPFFVKEGDIILVKEFCSLEVSFNDVSGENTTTQLISQNDILGVLQEKI